MRPRHSRFSPSATGPGRPGRFGAGVLSGILIAFAVFAGVTFVVSASGRVNVSAQESWGPLDRLFSLASTRSIQFHSPKTTNPFANDSTAVADALPHYREMCVVCHGAPGLDRSEIAEGLNPPAPDLSKPWVRDMSDGELYWVIAKGIRSTGMPSFENADDSETRWKIVSFVRHLPDLTAAERARLEEEASPEHGEEPEDSEPALGHPHGGED